jgi:formamidopyrimidine-DNA glycosylase
VFHLEGGARVTFNDARRFGAMDLMETAKEAEHWLIRDIGPEPLGNDFHETYLAARLAGRASPLKTLLLDQQIVAGLGNIYVSEALYRASLDPRRAGRSVTADDASRLVPVIRQVLGEAIEAGGSSLRDHRQADGKLGYFQHTFRVYDREGEACPTPGCGGQIQRIVQSGRSSFFCPLCQR